MFISLCCCFKNTQRKTCIDVGLTFTDRGRVFAELKALQQSASRLCKQREKDENVGVILPPIHLTAAAATNRAVGGVK